MNSIYVIERDYERFMAESVSDTGELLIPEEEFAERFNELQISHDEAVESAALYAKNEKQLADAIDKEIENLKARRDAHRVRAAKAEGQVRMATQQENFETARVKVTFRNSTATEISNNDDFIRWAKANGHSDLFDVKTVTSETPNKTSIKSWLRSGNECPYATVVDRRNMTIS